MKAVKQSKAASKSFGIEPLEERRLMTYGFWPRQVNMDDVFTLYPWLDGGGKGVAVIDQGIDYFHPLLGGDRATSLKAPKIVNVFDYVDDDTDPFPTTVEVTGTNSIPGHGTGVASILIGQPATIGGEQYKGILQNSLIYNLREDLFDSQNSINLSLQWILAHHTEFNITAVNLTDFIGTQDQVAIYNATVKSLSEAGVFIATPVANSFLGDPDTNTPPRQPINNPGSNPYVFAIGGLAKLPSVRIRPETQRGPDLDLLAPAQKVTLAYYQTDNPHELTLANSGDGNSWGNAHVVGTAVLLQQIDPTITPAEIMQIMKDSGPKFLDTDTVSDPNQNIYYSSLDMLGAVQLAYSRRDDSFDQNAGNDSLATAGTIALTNKKGSATNQKLLLHDHDYYKFTATAGAYDIDVTKTAGVYPGAELLDANGNLVATIGAGGLSQQTLAAGTYYVHLYDPNQALAGKYSISIDGSGGISPPSTVGDNGTFNGIAYDATGNLNFAWYDASAGNLKFAKRDANDVWSSVSTIDSGNMTGQCVSIAIDKNGRPGVAYYDAPNADLKYAHFNGSTWDVTVVDSKNSVGQNPSLKFNSAGNPVISYYKKTGGDLRLATKTASGFSITTIDATGDVGAFNSLALNPATGRWAVAYTDYTAGGFKYASQNANGAFSSMLVDAPGTGGGYVSLAFDKNKNPGFSYYDAKAADLRLARFSGGKWTKTVVAANNSQGSFSNLYFDPQASFNPAIIYWKRTGNTLVAARSNGSKFAFSTLATNGGQYAGIALDKAGNETVVWRDDTTGGLKIDDL